MLRHTMRMYCRLNRYSNRWYKSRYRYCRLDNCNGQDQAGHSDYNRPTAMVCLRMHTSKGNSQTAPNRLHNKSSHAVPPLQKCQGCRNSNHYNHCR